MQFKQAGRAVSGLRASYKVYIRYVIGMELPTYFRFVVDDLSIQIHRKIGQDMEEDPSMCKPDIGYDRWPPEGPNPIIADMDTDQTARASDQTLRDLAATKPIWQWEYVE